MLLKKFIDKNLIFAGLRPTDKADLLRQVVDGIKAQRPDMDTAVLLEMLEKREKESSTGIGEGIAIPHCELEGIDQMMCVMAHIPRGIDFGAMDQSLVHVIFLLIVPPRTVGDRLKLLARISRLVHNWEFVHRLTEAKDADELYDLIIQEDERHVD